MVHARQTVREAFAGLLKSPSTSHWKNVFEARIPLQRRVEPYLLVYVEQESLSQMTVHPGAAQDREATVIVRGFLLLSDNETAEDRMDAMAAAIEARLTLSALQGVAATAKVTGLQLEGTEMEIVGEDELKPTHAVMTMTYQITYTTAEGAPETLI